MIQQLVINGCSYMEAYAFGQGHSDLAERLDIRTANGVPNAYSLAIGGSANSRILRTTLKHSYAPGAGTLYVMGMTFVSREELPILDDRDPFEGRWSNPQNQQFSNRWKFGWTQEDTKRYVDLKLKWEVDSILDRTEDLMYRMLANAMDIYTRGHRVIMFQQADDLYQELLEHPRLRLFKNNPVFVQGFEWRAVPWQHSQGVPKMQYGPDNANHVPDVIAHRLPGHHQLLNEYLTNYIQEHKILQ
jgi:hypothetical protein